jgi:hypothetical protein
MDRDTGAEDLKRVYGVCGVGGPEGSKAECVNEGSWNLLCQLLGRRDGGWVEVR